MTDHLRVVDRIDLGTASIPTGGQWRVVATAHNAEWPGADERMTFACERLVNGAVVEAVGFFNEADCWDFLTSHGARVFSVYSQYGREETVVREGQAIPDGLVKRYAENVAKPDEDFGGFLDDDVLIDLSTTTTRPPTVTTSTTTTKAPGHT